MGEETGERAPRVASELCHAKVANMSTRVVNFVYVSCARAGVPCSVCARPCDDCRWLYATASRKIKAAAEASGVDHPEKSNDMYRLPVPFSNVVLCDFSFRFGVKCV